MVGLFSAETPGVFDRKKPGDFSRRAARRMP